MGERKVLNKYIPPDFDPKLVPRGKKSKDDLVPVRMMLPFSIQCSTCSSFMYRGRKFNSKKEPVRGPEGKYLSIQRFRFYIKCTVCSRPITFLTDPKNSDYEMESGATRNYEIWHDKDKTEEDIALEKEMEEKSDPMKALENRVLDSQREMADLDNLDEIKAMNMRHLQMMSASSTKGNSGSGFESSVKAVMDARELSNKKQQGFEEKEEKLNENGLTASEEAMVKQLKFGNRDEGADDNAAIRRLGKEDERAFDVKRQMIEAKLEKQQLEMAEKTNAPVEKKSIIPVVKLKRKRKLTVPAAKKKKTLEINVEKKNNSSSQPNHSESDGGEMGGGLGSLLGAYASDSD